MPSSSSASRFAAHDRSRQEDGKRRITVSIYAPDDDSDETQELRSRIAEAMRQAGQRVLKEHVASS